MNLFYLDHDVERCAQAHVDRHIVKMPIETTQMLCTVMREVCSIDYGYKSVYINHPTVRWAGSSIHNFLYLHKLGLALCDEYTYRYGRQHKSELVLLGMAEHMHRVVEMLENIPFTEPPKVVSAQLKELPTVEAYRQYYIQVKSRLFKWKDRKPPVWITEGGSNV